MLTFKSSIEIFSQKIQRLVFSTIKNNFDCILQINVHFVRFQIFLSSLVESFFCHLTFWFQGKYWLYAIVRVKQSLQSTILYVISLWHWHPPIILIINWLRWLPIRNGSSNLSSCPISRHLVSLSLCGWHNWLAIRIGCHRCSICLIIHNELFIIILKLQLLILNLI